MARVILGIIAALVAAVGVQTARLHSAQRKDATVAAQLAAALASNHSLEALTQEQNAQIDNLRAAEMKLAAAKVEAEKRAKQIKAAGDARVRAIEAHPPANDCRHVLDYYRAAARGFQW